MAPEKEMPMSEAEMTRELSEQGFEEREIQGKDGVKGKEQRDAQGRVILSDEHYENGDRQVIQTEHGEHAEGVEAAGAPSKEFGKLYTKDKEGEPTEKMLVREHPRTNHKFTLKGVSQDGVHLDAYVEATLENLGETLGDPKSHWSHFILEGPAVEKAFKRITAHGKEKSRALEGSFGSLELTVNGRAIDFKTFGKVSLDFDDDGKVKKATIHCRDWEAKV